MSVTLGELIQAATMAQDSDYKSLPEPPSEDTFYGARLGKNVQSNIGNMAKSQYTLLDESAFKAQNPYPQQVYPLNPPPFMTNYGQMGQYNSNYTQALPLPSPPPNAWVNEVQAGATPVSPINKVVQTRDGTVYMPREASLESVARAQQKPIYQYGELQSQPPFAGAVPMLKNAVKNDKPVPMKEGFQFMHGDYEDSDCIAVLRHVNNCPLCQRYFRCDNRMYVAMILMLVILFAIILILMMRK
jgi:hypothetical protein